MNLWYTLNSILCLYVSFSLGTLHWMVLQDTRLPFASSHCNPWRDLSSSSSWVLSLLTPLMFHSKIKIFPFHCWTHCRFHLLFYYKFIKFYLVWMMTTKWVMIELLRVIQMAFQDYCCCMFLFAFFALKSS